MTRLDDLPDFLNALAADVMSRGEWGKVADYIPELARVDPAQFAISVALADGRLISAGQSRTRFSIQSISKVYALACVLSRFGDSLWNRVGREPSGDRFDSILLLEQEHGRPRNPFINAGALVTTDVLLAGRAPKEALSEILQFIRDGAGDDDIHIDASVAASEKATGFRNVALANYLRSFDNLRETPDRVLGTYFHQCAIEMTTEQLALSGRCLAGLPDAPMLLSEVRRRRIAALMMTCGHYDGSGDFAFRTGLPGKSGVGGGILLVVPGRASVGIWSPGLNAWGNSMVGTEAAERLARFTGWSVFG
ncbi:glutaminase [Marivita sp. S6314]|uniref:glutaminase n=1 Tax=Marivita sp. S6314 TaxID=2926406 RepID=UPI001FF44ACB|nr:glutaminase [Marivita sp. S6314]MCK0149697.1 glutaminase [Marivita sp. S6314]